MGRWTTPGPAGKGWTGRAPVLRIEGRVTMIDGVLATEGAR
jgi:hypothetical protein